jgi:hypothetical protein
VTCFTFDTTYVQEIVDIHWQYVDAEWRNESQFHHDHHGDRRQRDPRTLRESDDSTYDLLS